jgi:general secretion pathway protein K
VAAARSERGFALLIVLWMLVLTSFLVAMIAGSGRTELRISSNLIANGQTAAAADGAVYQAIFNLIDSRPELRWPLDGSIHSSRIGDCVIDTRVRDEATRVNPNLASPALLEALLRTIGQDPQSARQLSIAIGEWIGAASPPRPKAVLLAEYRQAGRDYAPPGAPLLSLDELTGVVGMTAATLAILRPHLSLYAPALPTRADPIVAAALDMVARDNAPASLLPALPSNNRTARIDITAHGPSNATVTRTAIVKLGPAQAGGYAIVAWPSDPE